MKTGQNILLLNSKGIEFMPNESNELGMVQSNP